ncbi:MAG: PepSY domain-containing protein [Thiohalophilus sp.]|uniref:PepSY domain-containing protein n=1 Tax=Thiohalophilus sp. TaxID=3028392 RepID=UPI002870B257|nr:PepSY domain-containing protein [Thiohalophilus sp.]MDR9437693.1 PepSY domain-containing protein [Thiohalophilus sp.]
MMRYKSVLFSLLAAGGIGILASQGMDTMDFARADDKLDYREARELRQQGKILSLQEILQRVEKDYPGQVIETELEREHGSYIYELEILTDNGRVIELEVDAASGKILKTEEED